MTPVIAKKMQVGQISSQRPPRDATVIGLTERPKPPLQSWDQPRHAVKTRLKRFLLLKECP